MTSKKSRKEIKNITQHIFDLPTLPTTVARMIEVIDHPQTSAERLNGIIAGDQALAAQVLKLANSAYYGFPRRINTITLAIVVIGFETLKNFGLSAAVIDRYSKYRKDLPFDIYLFWEHSISTAIASKLMAKEVGHQVVGEAFAAGLLHDIGKFVISLYFREAFDTVVSNMIDDDIPMYRVEQQVLSGASHADVGAWLLDKWNLSGAIVEGIKHHHNPAHAQQNTELAAIVHFANYITKKLGVGFSGDLSTNQFDPDVTGILGLKKTEDGILDEDYYITMLCKELQENAMLFELIRELSGPPEGILDNNDSDRSEYAVSYG